MNGCGLSDITLYVSFFGAVVASRLEHQEQRDKICETWSKEPIPAIIAG